MSSNSTKNFWILAIARIQKSNIIKLAQLIISKSDGRADFVGLATQVKLRELNEKTPRKKLILRRGKNSKNWPILSASPLDRLILADMIMLNGPSPSIITCKRT